MKIQNNGWVEGREPEGVWVEGLGSVPRVLCRATLVFMAHRLAASVAWPLLWPAALAVLSPPLRSGCKTQVSLLSSILCRIRSDKGLFMHCPAKYGLCMAMIYLIVPSSPAADIRYPQAAFPTSQQLMIVAHQPGFSRDLSKHRKF